ncbi:heme A synthase [Endozoicomonas sp. SCSIO W0465]|uniref:COX15/CtaA family protein n=1 Tax=Endozoicomonas sp. SCSIO W0465 TaxID=2918516 RepID=UPI00207608AD|nr:COX15/CtaA family protein [Endozoicomonas sp. SCSIO W0465]USE36645.1 COX15/CtaA family protein [Endozoicomonas sp. SCSIO W0465]
MGSQLTGAVMKKKGFYLAVIATLLASIVVGLGAYTRLVHAGLGCPDWPGCYGFLTVPDTQQEIAHAESLFPDAPVEVDKGWAEMIHRYVAGTLMLLVLMIVIQAFKNRREPDQPFKLPILILVLITLQAAFGMWTVTLKLWPQVVTAHLLGGFATFSLLFLLTLRLSGVHRAKVPDKPFFFLKGLAVLSLLVVIGQISLGGWTSSNYAALACPDLPMCQGQWLPPMNFAEGFDVGQDIGPNYLGGQLHAEARTAIHFAHRIGALLIIMLLVLQMLIALRVSFKVGGSVGSMVRQLMLLIMIMLTVQVGLGLSNIIWSLPLSIAVAHNLGGALLLLSLVAYNYFLFGGSRRAGA